MKTNLGILTTMSNNYNNESLPDWVPCPSCGCEAYWDGSVYFCDQCGWSGDSDDVDE